MVTGFVVVVPSYGRAERVGGLTLALLDRHGVPRESVFIFVANAEERTSYSTQLGRAWPNIVVGVPTLWRQRNFIMRFFPPGTHVLSMDDDVEDIYRVKAGRNPAVMEDQTLELLHPGGLLNIVHDAERRMRTTGAHLWSLNVSDNPFYMMPSLVTKQHGLCNGFFWGCIVRHLPELELRHGDGHEDVERTVRFYQLDGVVLRYREFCAKTRPVKTNAGGLQASMSRKERLAAEQSSVRALIGEFPMFLRSEPGSILGLKFLCHGLSSLMKAAIIGLSDFKDVVARRKLGCLERGQWVALGKGIAVPHEDLGCQSRPCAGTLERCAPHGIVCLLEGGVRIALSLDEFYEALREGLMFIVWLPRESCVSIGIPFVERPNPTLFGLPPETWAVLPQAAGRPGGLPAGSDGSGGARAKRQRREGPLKALGEASAPLPLLGANRGA